MTFEQLHEKHRALWDWLAKNPEKLKSQAPENLTIGWDVDTMCFACVAADRRGRSEEGCLHCPIIWVEDEDGDCGSRGSPFLDWELARPYTEKGRRIRAEAAAKVRDMEWVKR